MVLREHGAPEVLHMEDLPEPVLRDTDVLVEVHATSVNPVDTKVRARATVPRDWPLVLGYDVSGTVVRCGQRVTQWQPGDEIFAAPNLFRPGANAEFVAIDARSAARKPAALDHASAATLPLVSQTAWEALHLRARIHPGQTVLIHAGAGGVGHIAVQLAKLHGCRVITTAGREESLAFCRDVLRADEVIDYRSQDVVAAVKKLTDGHGVPVAFDTVGGDVFVQCLDCVGINGHVVTILGGSTDLRQRGQSLLYRNVTISYEFMGIPTAHEIEPWRPGEILATIAKLADAGGLRPEVRHRFPLEQLANAHRQVETGRTVGKVAVLVKGWVKA
ncbi:MAG TPA: zinc-binding dehydrogenase [Steroidobacteraceae bacterium]|nr:zinc-binding dehydrogenase [Steroidobacteraceae bacterium]